jgi:hypothetical protein
VTWLVLSAFFADFDFANLAVKKILTAKAAKILRKVHKGNNSSFFIFHSSLFTIHYPENPSYAFAFHLK